MLQDDSGDYVISKLNSPRRWVLQFLERAKQTSQMYALVDVDITEPLCRIDNIARTTGQRISLSSYFLRCVALVIEKYPEVNSYLFGNRRIVRFKDVDIATIIDRKVDGMHVPTNYVIRAAQTKSIAMIQRELAAAKSENAEMPVVSSFGMKIFNRLPQSVQHFLWHRITRDPRKRKRLEGTILVSDVTQFTNRRSAVRAIAPSGASVTILFVNIAKQPWVVGKEIVPRDILHLTCSIDHRIADGSVMLGLKYLIRLLESGSELSNVPQELSDENGRPANTMATAETVKHTSNECNG
jgi:pyruvate/2-oxoglutarate dehydrogenase complex dihydrolipoamide acyltransferase (E2) component